MPKAKKATNARVALIDPFITTLLQRIVDGKNVLTFRKGRTIFAQGAKADAIYFIEAGKVKISVVSSAGKEAVLAMLGPRDFLGEGCMVGQSLRVTTATAIEDSTTFRIEREAMLRGLRNEPDLAEKFITSLLIRNMHLEEDLCDQLFNHSEKRLARVLLKLSRLNTHDIVSDSKIPVLSHETLAEMVGTTRARITHFMNKFRKMGFIDYNGVLTVRTELLTDVVLHD